MEYTKELAEQLASLEFELTPSNLISEVQIPEGDVYAKTTPNGKLVVLPADENKIGNPSQVFFISEGGVDSKFSTKESLSEDLAAMCGYSMGTTDAVALKSEDEEENKEAEDEGKSVVERYASVDSTPIMNRVKLYSKLHPNDDYTEILTLLESAKNMPQIEEIQSQHENLFPKMLIEGHKVSDETRSALDAVYNPVPPQTEEVKEPEVKVEDRTAEVEELKSALEKANADLAEEKSRNEELTSVVDRLGEQIRTLSERMAKLTEKLVGEIPNAQEPSGDRKVDLPKQSNLQGYGAMMKALASVPFEGEVHGK